MTQLPDQDKEHYLGDGLYVRFDGWAVWLRAPREHGDHHVAMEPAVWGELVRWINSYPVLKQHMSKR